MQDVHNLAWKLSGVLAGWADARLLDSYETERRPVAMRNVELSRHFWDRGRVSAATGYWLGFSYEEWADLYGAEPSGAVLVRPTGHVARRTRTGKQRTPGAEVELRSVTDRVLSRNADSGQRPTLTSARSAR